MYNAIRLVMVLIGRAILSSRYRVQITGLEKVRGLQKALVIPNHPGYVDPPLVMTTLWPALRPRPMLLASMFHSPLIFWLPRFLNAVAIPDLEANSAEARQETERSLRAVIEGLKAGNNHVLWPSGRVYRRTGRESLGAARSLSEILAEVPDVQLVLVRTRGVWGSMFSYAMTGKQPNLAMCLVKGIGILLANLIFLAPRRKISITIERMDVSHLPGITREKINPFLEAWYNAPGEEEPCYVPYHFLFGPRTYEYPKIASADEVDLSGVKAATKETVAQLVAEKLKRDASAPEHDAAMKLEDLGLDSLDRMELSLEIERRFGSSTDEVPLTVGGLWAVAEGLLRKAEPLKVPPAWFAQRATGERLGIIDETMGRAFVKRCLVSAGDVAVADDTSGLVSYEQLLVGALLLSRRFAEIPAANVGVLMPASVAAATVYFALNLAGKLPVMLNWTTGPGNLAHAAKTMGLTHVITSKRFIDRTAIVVDGTQYMHLEDVRVGIGKLEMLTTLLRVRYLRKSIERACSSQNPDAPAVVLFTSGSEKAPKAVPLTHRNILSNMTAALEVFHVTGHDILMGFLPPFHSFGLTINCILPILGGARVIYHPDPTDAATIARKTAGYTATILCGTPTFVSLILDRSHPGDMDTVRLLVVGAEKCPQSLFDKAQKVAPKSTVIEGYGITECSPIVSANREENTRRGSVGQPLPRIEVRVTDIESYQPLPQGQTGMLLVHGSNIFPGYIGEGGDPFTQQDGKRWYVTGDLARLDEDGFIWLAGRLKRFIKAGGEMISLPAIEEPFTQAYPPGEQGPNVAVEGIELADGRRIVLFTTETLTLRQANELLQAKGLRGIMRLDEVRKLDKIPILGTGKTDYKVLRAMIQTSTP